MKEQLIYIVAAVVDTENLTMYLPDGSTLVIPQGDPRVRRIIDSATSQLMLHGIAQVDIAKVGDDDANAYADFEKQSSGVVRFFRVAKRRLKSLFSDTSTEPVEPTTVGQIPPQVSVERMTAAVNDIIANATSASSTGFHEEGLNTQAPIQVDGHTPKEHTPDDAEDTIVAVVGNTVVPGVEKIRNQFARASKLGSTVGVENFLKRLGGIIGKRSHSVEDLLKFMERGDLPIADDGSILVYKVLNRNTDDGKYRDCHTGNVPQWVGAYVCMDPSLVDHNRNNECSNGLHIARRGYVSQFRGSVCVLAKVAPEDVITVPTYDANKMRACGYHIIAELTAKQYSLLNRNQPITDDPEGKVLLADAILGRHINRTHEVRITGGHGTGVVITDLAMPEVKHISVKVAPADAMTDRGEAPRDLPVDPKAVVEKVLLSRKEQAMKLSVDYHANPTQANYDALMRFKKLAKVSWDKLGIVEPVSPASQVAQAVTTPMGKPAKKKAKHKAKKASDKAQVKREPAPVPKAHPEAAKPASKPAASRVVNEVELGLGSYRERVQKLLPVTSVGAAQAILALKKQSKKSWTVLGVSMEVQAEIHALLSQGK